MAELTVGVRELKSRLSEVLRRANAAQTVLITDPGQPVARIVPVGQPREALAADGSSRVAAMERQETGTPASGSAHTG